MTTTRAQQKVENRAKLIAAARKVFAEKGLAAATARDIVRETDLASGTFYNYFDDKEDAFRAVFEEFAEPARAAGREKRLQPGMDLERRVYDAYLSLVRARRRPIRRCSSSCAGTPTRSR